MYFARTYRIYFIFISFLTLEPLDFVGHPTTVRFRSSGLFSPDHTATDRAIGLGDFRIPNTYSISPLPLNRVGAPSRKPGNRVSIAPNGTAFERCSLQCREHVKYHFSLIIDGRVMRNKHGLRKRFCRHIPVFDPITSTRPGPLV